MEKMEMHTQEKLRVMLIRCGQKLGSGTNAKQTQGRILKILYYHGPMTQKMLQEKLGIQPGSMSEIAAKLQRKGLLQREKDDADRRRILLTLTDCGRADVERFQRQQGGKPGAHFDALTQAEQESLMRLLEKLLDSWSETPERNR